MDLSLSDRWFVVTGASSGLGNAVTEVLAKENAHVIAVARRDDLLEKLSLKYPGKVIPLKGDVTDERTLLALHDRVKDTDLDGVFVNAGGPPARSIAETTLDDWDAAYSLVLRWKVHLISLLLPKMVSRGYGRVLFSESSTLKQPLENMVLSNSLRLAVAGFSKTLSEEYAHKGITFNIIAPGFHDTEAIHRIFKKKSELENISVEEAREMTLRKIKVGAIGQPVNYASLAAWLLSPHARFVTGQVYCIDGGAIKSTL